MKAVTVAARASGELGGEARVSDRRRRVRVIVPDARFLLTGAATAVAGDSVPGPLETRVKRLVGVHQVARAELVPPAR